VELLPHELAKLEEAEKKEGGGGGRGRGGGGEEEEEEKEAKKSLGNSEKKAKAEAEKSSEGSARSGARGDTQREKKRSSRKAKPYGTAGACAEADPARKKRRQTNAKPHLECSPTLTQTDHGEEEATATFKIGEKVRAKYNGHRYEDAIITGFDHTHSMGALRYVVAWYDKTPHDLIKGVKIDAIRKEQ